MMGKEFKFINPDYINRVLDYAEKIESKEIEPKRAGSLSYHAFTFAVQLYGYNSFPTIISDAEFESLETTTLYRGVKDPEHNANLLCDYDYHYGYGTWADGIYSSDSYDMAYHYTPRIPDYQFMDMEEYRDDVQKRHERVMTFKIAPDTKCVHLNKIFQQIRIAGPAKLLCLPEVREIFRFTNSLSKSRAALFTKLINDNVSLAALFTGYEEIHTLNEENGEMNIVLNRGKMIVSETEFKRVCALSRKYKDGTIDFEQKYADPEVEFLNE